MDEALQMAVEALALHLYGMEQDNEMIPLAFSPSKVHYPEDADPNAFVTLIQTRTEPVRDEIMNRAVKKNAYDPKLVERRSRKGRHKLFTIIATGHKG